MITRQNINEVLKLITDKDLNRLKNTEKEYCVLYLHCTNNSSWVTITLTNDYNKYKNVSNNGNCIFDTLNLLKELESLNIIPDIFKNTKIGY